MERYEIMIGRILCNYNSVIIIIRKYKDCSGWSYRRDDNETYYYLGSRSFESFIKMLLQEEQDILDGRVLIHEIE